MNTLEQLLAKWEAGTLSPEEKAELKQLLATREARASLVADWLLDEAIYDTFRSQPAAAPAMAQEQAAPHPESSAHPARATRPGASASLRAGPPRRRRPFRWLVWHEVRLSIRLPLGLAAAACLILAGLHFYFQHTAIGQLASARTGVSLERAGRKLAAVAGQSLYPGDIIRVPAGGAGTVHWANELTTLDLAGGSELRVFNPMRGKRLSLGTGTLEALVSSQPWWRPMIITTPQAEAKVLGTHFSLSASSTATRLEVLEGAIRLHKNRLSRADDKKEVVVKTGEMALAAADAKLEVQFLTGFLTSDLWSAPPGTAFADVPAKGKIVTPADAAVGGFRPAMRLCGFVVAPATGDYTFWIASFRDQTLREISPAELWLSSDDNPANKQRIAYALPPNAAKPGTGTPPLGGSPRKHSPANDFRISPSQKSAPQSLVKGRRYYIEVWHEGLSSDSMALGWRLPGEPLGNPPTDLIDKQFLSPLLDAAQPDTRVRNK